MVCQMPVVQIRQKKTGHFKKVPGELNREVSRLGDVKGHKGPVDALASICGIYKLILGIMHSFNYAYQVCD